MRRRRRAQASATAPASAVQRGELSAAAARTASSSGLCRGPATPDAGCASQPPPPPSAAAAAAAAAAPSCAPTCQAISKTSLADPPGRAPRRRGCARRPGRPSRPAGSAPSRWRARGGQLRPAVSWLAARPRRPPVAGVMALACGLACATWLAAAPAPPDGTAPSDAAAWRAPPSRPDSARRTAACAPAQARRHGRRAP